MQKWSLQQLPSKPPKSTRQLPMKPPECLRRALGDASAMIITTSPVDGSMEKRSCKSSVALPPKTQINPSQQCVDCPHLAVTLFFKLTSFQVKSSRLSVSLNRVKSNSNRSPRQLYFPQHPPNMQIASPFIHEEWNLLALGLTFPCILTSFHARLWKLQSHRSPRSSTPSPPNTNKQGQLNQAE